MAGLLGFEWVLEPAEDRGRRFEGGHSPTPKHAMMRDSLFRWVAILGLLNLISLPVPAQSWCVSSTRCVVDKADVADVVSTLSLLLPSCEYRRIAGENAFWVTGIDAEVVQAQELLWELDKAPGTFIFEVQFFQRTEAFERLLAYSSRPSMGSFSSGFEVRPITGFDCFGVWPAGQIGDYGLIATSRLEGVAPKPIQMTFGAGNDDVGQSGGLTVRLEPKSQRTTSRGDAGVVELELLWPEDSEGKGESRATKFRVYDGGPTYVDIFAGRDLSKCGGLFSELAERADGAGLCLVIICYQM